MTSDGQQPPGEPRELRARRRTVVVASLVFLVATAVFAVARPFSTDGDRELIVGPWTGAVIAAASATVAIVALSVIAFAVPARRWWWALLVPLRLLLVLSTLVAGLWLTVTNDSVTPIVADGCATGYVVSERSFLFGASGEVLRMDGVIGTRVARTVVDDGHTPFAQGSYIAVVDGDSLRVWNTFESSTEDLRTSSAPSFVLPRVNADAGCGLAGGRDPAATPTPRPTVVADGEGPAPSAVGDAREELSRMAALTLGAVVGTPRDAAGAPVSAPPAADLPCDGTTGVSLAFATDDNAASYAAILAAWTRAGYAADRAMQEDRRDNGTVRLSARDRSSIDGLLHFSLTADCLIG